jgi:hypothetical protein
MLTVQSPVRSPGQGEAEAKAVIEMQIADSTTIDALNPGNGKRIRSIPYMVQTLYQISDVLQKS